MKENWFIGKSIFFPEFFQLFRDKLKKKREEKLSSREPDTGRGSPSRIRNLERAVIRQPNHPHDKGKISPDHKTSVVVVKKPSPGLEKQIHRTNAELRNTKKIVQVIEQCIKLVQIIFIDLLINYRFYKPTEVIAGSETPENGLQNSPAFSFGCK